MIGFSTRGAYVTLGAQRRALIRDCRFHFGRKDWVGLERYQVKSRGKCCRDHKAKYTSKVHVVKTNK